MYHGTPRKFGQGDINRPIKRDDVLCEGSLHPKQIFPKEIDMWRAFFFAVGITFILLGLQCLVADSFVVSSQARLPGFVKKILNEKSETTPANASSPIALGGASSGMPQMTGPNSGSRFGPSRFESQYNSGNYYGGQANQSRTSSQFNSQPDSQFSLAGYGSQANNSFQRMSAPPTAISAGKPSQILKTKDWMPWSLLAVGTLVVLYTNSSSRRFSNN